MDELEFRRAIYADPNHISEELKNASADSAYRQQAWADAQRLQQDIQKAMEVNIPHGMVERLYLKQTMRDHVQQKRKWFTGLAASVALALSVGTVLVPTSYAVDLSSHALAHVYHEGDMPFNIEQEVLLQQVNAKLANYSAQFSQAVQPIYYAKFCDFQKIQSLHLVMQGQTGKVSVFIVPHMEKQTLKEQFSDPKYNGYALDLGELSLIVVGEKQEPLQSTAELLRRHLQMSA